MAIRHTPRPLKGKIWPFNVLALALGLGWLVFGSLALCSARWIGWPIAITLWIVIFISLPVVHWRVRRRIGASMEKTICPRCRKRRMGYREEWDERRQAYLVCPDCGTKWHVGEL